MQNEVGLPEEGGNRGGEKRGLELGKEWFLQQWHPENPQLQCLIHFDFNLTM